MFRKIKFFKHAKRKLKEQCLEESIIERVLKDPTLIFYDLTSKTMIAIAEVIVAGSRTNLIIPYVNENDLLKVVTIYPCKNIGREIKRKERIKWVRIK